MSQTSREFIEAVDRELPARAGGPPRPAAPTGRSGAEEARLSAVWGVCGVCGSDALARTASPDVRLTVPPAPNTQAGPARPGQAALGCGVCVGCVVCVGGRRQVCVGCVGGDGRCRTRCWATRARHRARSPASPVRRHTPYQTIQHRSAPLSRTEPHWCSLVIGLCRRASILHRSPRHRVRRSSTTALMGCCCCCCCWWWW